MNSKELKKFWDMQENKDMNDIYICHNCRNPATGNGIWCDECRENKTINPSINQGLMHSKACKCQTCVVGTKLNNHSDRCICKACLEAKQVPMLNDECRCGVDYVCIKCTGIAPSIYTQDSKGNLTSNPTSHLVYVIDVEQPGGEIIKVVCELDTLTFLIRDLKDEKGGKIVFPMKTQERKDVENAQITTMCAHTLTKKCDDGIFRCTKCDVARPIPTGPGA